MIGLGRPAPAKMNRAHTDTSARNTRFCRARARIAAPIAKNAPSWSSCDSDTFLPLCVNATRVTGQTFGVGDADWWSNNNLPHIALLVFGIIRVFPEFIGDFTIAIACF